MALPEDNSRNYELQEGVVIHRDDIDADTPHLVADQVLVAAEVVAPGTLMVDTVVKPVEYAKAGIPFYWVIDLGEPLSLVAYHLAEDGRYREASAATRIFETSEPFSLEVDLVGLSEGRNT